MAITLPFKEFSCLSKILNTLTHFLPLRTNVKWPNQICVKLLLASGYSSCFALHHSNVPNDTATAAIANIECKNFTHFFHSSYTENCHLLCSVQFVLLTVHRQDAWGCCIFCIWLWSIDTRDGGPSSDIPTEKKYFSFCWNWQYSLSYIPKVSIRCNSLEIFQVWEGAFPFICRSLISWMCTYKTVS